MKRTYAPVSLLGASSSLRPSLAVYLGGLVREHGLTAEEISIETRIPPRRIRAICSGRVKQPHWAELIAICHVLRLPFSAFLFRAFRQDGIRLTRKRKWAIRCLCTVIRIAVMS